MKFVSKFALAFSAAALIAVPAAYAADEKPKKEKKGKEAAAVVPKKSYSKEFIKQYSLAADALNKAKDVAAAKALFPAVVASVQNDDDRYEAGVLAINIGAQTKDLAFQQQGIDLVLASASVTPEIRREFTFRKGAYAYDNKNYAGAEKLMIDAYNLGHRGSNIEFLISNAQSLQNRDKEAVVWLGKAIDSAKGNSAAQKPYIIRAASLAAKSKDYAGAANWYKSLLKTESNSDYWHDALVYFDRSLTLNPEESLDLMRLIRAAGALRFQQEYAQYLESLSYIGVRYPAEAVAVLEEGFSKGIISRSNVSFGERYNEAKARLTEDTATLAGTAGPAKAPNAKPILTSLTADSFYSHKNYQVAKDLYELALQKGAVLDKGGVDQADRTRFRLAMSKAMLGDYAGAKADFALISGANRKAMAEYWIMFVDQKASPPAAAAPAAS